MNGLIELLNWALEHWFFSLLIAVFILMVIEQLSNCIIRIAAIHGLTKVGYFTMFCNNLNIFKRAQDIKKNYHSKDWCDYLFDKVQLALLVKDLKLTFSFPDNYNSVQKDQLIISLEFYEEGKK